MSEENLKLDNVTEDNKFDLSVWRSAQERIAMVIDPDCPRDILESVVTYDMDNEVVFHTLIAKKMDQQLIDKIKSRFNVDDVFINQKKKLIESDNEEIIKKVMCAVPWNHASTNASGTVRMCCQMIYETRPDDPEGYGTVIKEDGTTLTTADDISQHRNAPTWKKIRKEMLSGKRPDLCKLCWDEEDNGIGSRRDWTNRIFSETVKSALINTNDDGSIDEKLFPLEHWDLRFGNKCNLACRSCGPSDSDLWYKDWVPLTGKNTFFPGKGQKEVTINLDKTGKVASIENNPFEWYNKSNLIDNIKQDMKSIKRFYFTGGEPTINHTHREILQYAIDNDYAKDITLDYNTNMAGVPSAIFKQWKKFKEVGLGMSIDGIFEHFEYIRYPGKWPTAYKNLMRIENESGFDHVTASITMTVSIMNVLHVLDMQWWVLEQNWKKIAPSIIVHNLYGPPHLNIQHIPDTMKKYITDRYYKFIKDMKSNDWNTTDKSSLNATLRLIEKRLMSIILHMNQIEGNPEHWNEFFKTGERLDAIRGEDWKESLPEIEKMIRICNDTDTRKNNVTLASAGKK